MLCVKPERRNPDIQIQTQYLPYHLRKTKIQSPNTIFRIRITDSEVTFSFGCHGLNNPTDYINFITTIFKPCKQWWMRPGNEESFDAFVEKFLVTGDVSNTAGYYLDYLQNEFFAEKLYPNKSEIIRIDYGGPDIFTIDYNHSKAMVEVIIVAILKKIFFYLEEEDPTNIEQHANAIRNIVT